MPHSLKIEKYPAFYLELIEFTWPYIIPCQSKREANNTRFRLYGFIEALRKQNHPATAKMDGTLISIRIVDGVWAIVLENRDDANDPVLRALRGRQSAEAPPPIPASSEAVSSETDEPLVAKPTASDRAVEEFMKGKK